MAKLSNQVISSKILDWYASKMLTDTGSITKRDAFFAFFSCAIKETFQDHNITEEDRWLEAIISMNGAKIEVTVPLWDEVMGGSYHVKYSVEGPDKETSVVASELLSKAQSPNRVSGSELFASAGTQQATSEPNQETLTTMDMALLLPARIFALAFWTIFGFALWIPILVRSHLFVSGAMAFSALSGKRKDGLYRLIRYANTFWIRGFRNISDFGSDRTSDDNVDIMSSLMMLVIEASFAIVFYGLIYLALK